MRKIEAQQSREEPGKRKARQATDDDRPVGPLPVSQVDADVRQPSQAFRDRAAKSLAFQRRLRPAGASKEKVLAQPFLENLHVLADRALADTELCGSRGEVGQPAHRLEGAQGREWHVDYHISQSNGWHNDIQMAQFGMRPDGRIELQWIRRGWQK